MLVGHGGDTALLCGQATSEQGHGVPALAALTQEQRTRESLAPPVDSPRAQLTGGTPRPWQTTYADAHYLSSTASLRPSPRVGGSPRERVVPPHLVAQHFFFGDSPMQPGHGSIHLPSEMVSDAPAPLWGLRSTEVSRRNVFGLTPGEASAAELELNRQLRAAARAGRSDDSDGDAAVLVTVASSRASSPATRSRLGTPRPIPRGDVHARLVASSRIRAYQQEYGRLRETSYMRKPGFVLSNSLGVPTPRTWRVCGVPTDYTPRIAPPPSKAPASTSIMDSFG